LFLLQIGENDKKIVEANEEDYPPYTQTITVVIHSKSSGV